MSRIKYVPKKWIVAVNVLCQIIIIFINTFTNLKCLIQVSKYIILHYEGCTILKYFPLFKQFAFIISQVIFKWADLLVGNHKPCLQIKLSWKNSYLSLFAKLIIYPEKILNIINGLWIEPVFILVWNNKTLVYIFSGASWQKLVEITLYLVNNAFQAVLNKKHL